MRLSSTSTWLRVLGLLLGALGIGAWIQLARLVPADLGELSAQGEEGGRLVAWALVGTVLMIGGMILLHFGQAASEREEREAGESTS